MRSQNREKIERKLKPKRETKIHDSDERRKKFGSGMCTKNRHDSDLSILE